MAEAGDNLKRTNGRRKKPSSQSNEPSKMPRSGNGGKDQRQNGRTPPVEPRSNSSMPGQLPKNWADPLPPPRPVSDSVTDRHRAGRSPVDRPPGRNASQMPSRMDVRDRRVPPPEDSRSGGNRSDRPPSPTGKSISWRGAIQRPETLLPPVPSQDAQSPQDRRGTATRNRLRMKRRGASDGDRQTRLDHARRNNRLTRQRSLEAVPSSKPVKTVPPRKRSLSSTLLLYGVRLLILGVGVGVVAGTLLSVWDPATRFTNGVSQMSVNPVAKNATRPQKTEPIAIKPEQEMVALKGQIRALAAQHPQLLPGVFLYDPDTGNYLDLNGELSLPAASTIKVPILAAFLQAVDAGNVQLDEPLTLKPEFIATGSGDLQFRNPGTRYTALEVATKMITISDNTATNMLIDRLGGAVILNQQFRSWGLTGTQINSILPDLQGTNTTTPRDLVHLMARINQGNLLSLRSRDQMLNIMRRTVNNSLIPVGVGEGAIVAHKTGDIGTLLGDTGLVDAINGKQYIVTILVKRPFNDPEAQDLIQQISQLIYQATARLPRAGEGEPDAAPGEESAPPPEANLNGQ